MGPSSFSLRRRTPAVPGETPPPRWNKKRKQRTRTAGSSPRPHRALWCCVLRQLSGCTAGLSSCSGERAWMPSSRRPRCLCQTSVGGDATSSLGSLETMAGVTQLQQSACGRLGGVIEPVWRLASQFSIPRSQFFPRCRKNREKELALELKPELVFKGRSRGQMYTRRIRGWRR
jgi:hypothetical protein